MRFIVPPRVAISSCESPKVSTDSEIIDDITKKTGEILSYTYPKDPLLYRRRLISMKLGNIILDEKKARNNIEYEREEGMERIKSKFKKNPKNLLRKLLRNLDL